MASRTVSRTYGPALTLLWTSMTSSAKSNVPTPTTGNTLMRRKLRLPRPTPNWPSPLTLLPHLHAIRTPKGHNPPTLPIPIHPSHPHPNPSPNPNLTHPHPSPEQKTCPTSSGPMANLFPKRRPDMKNSAFVCTVVMVMPLILALKRHPDHPMSDSRPSSQRLLHPHPS